MDVLTATKARKIMPKFHGDDYLATSELEEEELSEMELDANGLFEMDSDEEDEEDAMRSDIRERQKIAKANMEKDAADELRDFQQKLIEEKEKAMKLAYDEARQTRDKHASMKSNHFPYRNVATDKDREELKRTEDDIEAQRSMECEIAENSEEERAANEKSDHLEYIAQVRFEQECNNRLAEEEEKKEAERQKQKEKEQKILQDHKMKCLAEEKEKKEAERQQQNEKEQKILQDHEMRKQLDEKKRIDAEYEIQKKEQNIRIANIRAAVLLGNLSGAKKRRGDDVKGRQAASRRATLNKKRDAGEEAFQKLHDDNLFIAGPMKYNESIDDNFDEEDDDDEFNSDTPLMNEEDEVDSSRYASFDDDSENDENMNKEYIRL